MAPSAALAYEYADPVADAVDQLLRVLDSSRGDRLVLETEQIPMLLVGDRKCALMVGRLSYDAIRQIAMRVFPREYLDALEEVGGTRFHWPGFTALATYGESGLTLEIMRAGF